MTSEPIDLVFPGGQFLRFMTAEGVLTKNAIAMAVFSEDGKILCHTGWDSHMAANLKFFNDMGTRFGGRLYRGGKTVGHVLIGSHDVEVEFFAHGRISKGITPEAYQALCELFKLTEEI